MRGKTVMKTQGWGGCSARLLLLISCAFLFALSSPAAATEAAEAGWPPGAEG